MTNYRGSAFVRTTIAMLDPQTHDHRSALDFAQKAWGSSSQPATVLKAAVAAGGIGSSMWGSNLAEVQGAQMEFLDIVRPMTIVGRLVGLRRVPIGAPVAATSSAAIAYFVGQGKTKPVTALAFNRKKLGDTKVVGLVVTSNELLKYGINAEIALRDDMASAIAQATDAAFINPANTGVAGERPAAVTVGAVTIASSGTGAAAIRTDVEAAIAAFKGDLTTAAWVTHPRVAVAIGLRLSAAGIASDVGALGGTLAGLPLLTSEAVPFGVGGGSLTLLDAAAILFGEEGLTPSSSTEATVAMSDNPETAAVVPHSLWQTNCTGLMLERTVNWQVGLANAVVMIAGANYTGV